MLIGIPTGLNSDSIHQYWLIIQFMKYIKDSKPTGKDAQPVDTKNGDKPSEKKKWTNRKERGEFRTKQKLNMLR